jgi:hypothetical protein
MTQRDIARRLVDRHGPTFAEQAGFAVTDKPSPLWRLLVLSLLLSARISSDIAVSAARELNRAGYRAPKAMREATWQQGVDALGRGHYRRYDERTATMLGECADLAIEHYRAAKGARRLGLTPSPGRLAALVREKDLPRLVAGCVRAARHKDVVDDVLEAA